MRVLFVVHTTHMDGSSISFLNLIKGLIKKGVDIIVAGPNHSKNNYFIKKLEEVGVTYNEVRITESIYPSKSVLFLLKCMNLLCKKHNSYKDILNVAKQFSPDIIHSNVGTIQEGFWVAKRLNIPHVWHLREYQDKDFGWRFFPSKESFIKKLRKSFVITITNDIRNYFNLSNFANCTTIYNGIYKLEQPLEIMPKDNYFLSCSRISEEKGIDDIVKAFALFYKDHKKYKLKILGNGDVDYVNSLKILATECGCAEAIEWIGFKNDVMPYMIRAKALIVASRYEGFGRMTAEAAFAGTIVIGRGTGGTKEILNDTGGYLFNNFNELLNSMYVVSKLPTDQYQQMAKVAQDKAHELYSVEQNVEKTYEFYKLISND